MMLRNSGIISSYHRTFHLRDPLSKRWLSYFRCPICRCGGDQIRKGGDNAWVPDGSRHTSFDGKMTRTSPATH
eukprot:5330559-Amphidinium_carterae.1